MANGEIKGFIDSKVFMDEAQLCRENFKTERLTFGLSELEKGDALLIPQGNCYRLFNVGEEKVIIT
jgi:hypothetical protein